MGRIRINQLGYTPGSSKQVIYTGEGKKFEIYSAENQELCYTGELKKARLDEASWDYISAGDFSTFQKQGRFYIQINEEKSYQFRISGELHRSFTDAVLKAYYYQRCGMELTEEYAGEWKHPVCHLQPSYLFRQDAEELLRTKPEELVCIDSTGGWHDAGDYGRYTIASVKTLADLLLAYEHFPEAFQHSIHIPESEKDGADILHEIRYGLDFLFKMQREKDGGVYTKVATRNFPDMIMPETDQEPLFVFNISSPATGGFSAVMAMAAGIFKCFDPAYAKRCLKASEKAYGWLKQNPEPLFFYNPQNVRSGEYGDKVDTDERYWAAAQLYRTTGKEEYHKDFLMHYGQLANKLTLGWRSVGGYGSMAYLFTEQPVHQEIYEALKKEWLKNAGELAQRSRDNGYGITLALNEYVWGSLMVLSNESITLILAERLLKQSLYNEIIEHNWDYLLGMNPMDISYVTGFGENRVMHPHHRPSASDGIEEPVPGLIAGGPCANLLDEIAQEKRIGNPPAKCYIDHEMSFSTNEIDIYWNSPAVYVGAYLMQRSQNSGTPKQ